MIRMWWVNHGTKIIGFSSAAAAMITYVDHETVNLIGGFFGPKWGPVVSHSIFIGSGLATAYRGFTNARFNKT